MTKKEFSQAVKALIDKEGLSQKFIHEKTGISRTVLTHAYNANFDKFAVKSEYEKSILDSFPNAFGDNDPRTTAEIEEENKELLKKLVEVQEKLLREKEANQITKEDYERKINEILATLQVMQEKIDKLD